MADMQTATAAQGKIVQCNQFETMLCLTFS